MELTDAMRTTHACRRYLPDPIPDEVLYRAIEAARFAPQGGNRQGVRFVIVRDAAKRRRLAELYLPRWKAVYEPVREALLTPTDEPAPLGFSDPLRQHEETNRFAEHFAEHPVVIVACVEAGALHHTDADLPRTPIVGGASVYPMVQNLCLALRDEGVATRLTTLLVADEEQVKELLGIPEEYITACHVVAGYPERGFPQRLQRRPVQELAFVDTFGAPLGVR